MKVSWFLFGSLLLAVAQASAEEKQGSDAADTVKTKREVADFDDALDELMSDGAAAGADGDVASDPYRGYGYGYGRPFGVRIGWRRRYFDDEQAAGNDEDDVASDPYRGYGYGYGRPFGVRIGWRRRYFDDEQAAENDEDEVASDPWRRGYFGRGWGRGYFGRGWGLGYFGRGWGRGYFGRGWGRGYFGRGYWRRGWDNDFVGEDDEMLNDQGGDDEILNDPNWRLRLIARLGLPFLDNAEDDRRLFVSDPRWRGREGWGGGRWGGGGWGSGRWGGSRWSGGSWGGSRWGGGRGGWGGSWDSEL